MHPDYCQITILLVVDLCSSLAYFVMTQPLPIAGKMLMKTLVASNYQLILIHVLAHLCKPVQAYMYVQSLLSYTYICICTYIYSKWLCLILDFRLT